MIHLLYLIHVCFRRGTETILGETSDPLELFSTDECDDSSAETVVSKVQVCINCFFLCLAVCRFHLGLLLCQSVKQNRFTFRHAHY